VNKTITQLENAQGQIRDLSVSVILDNSASTEDYSDRVRDLVATAIGVDADRVTIEMLPFVQMEDEADVTDAFSTQQQLLASLQDASTLRTLIIAAAALLTMVLILIMVRTLAGSRVQATAVDDAPAGMDILVDEPAVPTPEFKFTAPENTDLSELEKYIDKSPESVAQLLRNWLSDDMGR
jgi:flagellar M-ring protein FliF